MNKFLVRIMGGLVLGMIVSAMVYALQSPRLFSLPYNTSLVVNGDTVWVSGNPSIEAELYATDAKEKTVLVSEDFSFRSEPGAMDGYYDFVGPIPPGIYEVHGATATFRLIDENAVLENQNTEERERNTRIVMSKVAFFFGLVMGFLVTPGFVEIKTDDEE